MRLKHAISICTTPKAVTDFFEGMESNYSRWHPDHRLFRWERGHGLKRGTVFYFEEVIGGKLLKKRMAFTHVNPEQRIEFAFTNWALRLILPYIRFEFRHENDHVNFVQEISIRTGPIGAWMNRREFDAVRQHMREEGENLKRILEDADDKW